MVVPMLNIGTRNVVYNNQTKEAAKIETAKMKLFRNIADYTKKEQVRNTKIREELSIFIQNAKTIKSRSQWNYHAHRMEDSRIAKEVVTYDPKRRGSIGRLQLRWRDQPALQEVGTDHVWYNP
jgi:hypothetical protein